MVQFEVLSDIGRKRTVNEDSAAVFSLADGITLAVIADGMGGHQGGDFASSTAVQLLEEEFMKLKMSEFINEETRSEWLRESIFYVNRVLYNHANDNVEFKGMGTTLEAALIHGNSCLISHVGDSRIYAISHKGIRQVTKDHSYVNVLIESGEITEEEAANHPQRNLIMKALGSERTIDPEFYSIEFDEEMYLLLCTDGLSNKVDNHSIQTIVLAEITLKEKVEALVALANKMGGEDNISVILLRPTDTEVPER